MKTAEALLDRPSIPKSPFHPNTFESDELLIDYTIDRIFPTPEASGLENDLREIGKLQRKFNKVLGIDRDEDGIKNYNPVLARWRYETLTTDEQRQSFRAHESKQVETALRERYDSAESTLIYAIDENHRLRNSEIFPEEAFAKGLQRGVLYLRQQGSPDSEREEKEVEGFLRVEEVMVSPTTQIGTKMMVISPPSKLKGSIYVKNFVDFYELEERDGKRVVKMTRFASDSSYGDVSDAYLLSHPTKIEADGKNVYEIFKEKFIGQKEALKEGKMQEILTASRGRIRFFINALCNGDPESIALSFNAVLNGADMIKRAFNQIKEKIVLPVFRTITDEVEWLGRLAVEKIAGACGMSSGFSLKGLKSLASLIGGSISSILGIGFGKEGKFKVGTCNICHSSGMVGECSICQNCAERMN